jgi:hypothetical protein
VGYGVCIALAVVAVVGAIILADHTLVPGIG